MNKRPSLENSESLRTTKDESPLNSFKSASNQVRPGELGNNPPRFS